MSKMDAMQAAIDRSFHLILNHFDNFAGCDARSAAVETISRLCAAGCNVNQRLLHNGSSSLHTAVFYDDHSLVEVLLNCGADIAARDMNGRTIFHYHTSAHCFDVLLSRNPDFQTLDAIDNNGWTALQGWVGYEFAIKGLLVAGARVDIANRDGNTALHRICLYLQTGESFECLLWILAASLDDTKFLNRVNKHGMGACDYVRKSLVGKEWIHSLVAAGAQSSGPTKVDKFCVAQCRAILEEKRAELQRLIFEKRIKPRALLICIALQSLSLPALISLYIVDAAADTREEVPMHKKWNLIAAIKHYLK